jgi:hypothetical protein
MKPEGGAWSQPKTVSNDTALLHSHPSQPWLAADRSGNLHVTWQIDIRPFVKHRLRQADGTWLAPVMVCSLQGYGGFDPEGVLDPSGRFFIPGRDSFIIDSAGVVERLVFAVAPNGGDPQDTIQGDWVRHLADVKAIACDSTGRMHLFWTRNPPGIMAPEVYWFSYKPR